MNQTDDNTDATNTNDSDFDELIGVATAQGGVYAD
jgi:hypothetical protein